MNYVEWDKVMVYYWNWPAGYEVDGGWPGVEISQGDDGLYRVVFNKKFTFVIFHNGSGLQTADLNVPKNDQIVFDNADNCWMTYAEAIAILKGNEDIGGNDPIEPEHIHAYEYNLISYSGGFALEGHCTQTNCDEPTIITDEGITPEYTRVSPTCISDGYGIWTYVKDGKEYKLSITFPAVSTNHSYDDGKCIYCQAADPNKPTEPDTPEHVHVWTDASCTSPMICSGCGETSGSAKGHSWISATCTTPEICSSCGELGSSAIGHSWVSATCTEAKTCSTCGEVSGTPNGHTWVDPTCTTPKTCSSCGIIGGSATGHAWTLATCITPVTCALCGATSGSANGHNFYEGICTTCGAGDPSYTDPSEKPNPDYTDEEWALFNDLFDYNNKISINLKISNSELKKIQ